MIFIAAFVATFLTLWLVAYSIGPAMEPRPGVGARMGSDGGAGPQAASSTSMSRIQARYMPPVYHKRSNQWPYS